MTFLKKIGFSLVEVLIVLVIITVLALMIMPAYQHYIVRSNRSDAIKSILFTQLSEEKHRTNHPAYYPQSPGIPSMNDYYTITVTNVSPTTYTIIATAGSAQSTDTECTTITLSYANGTTTKSPTLCWQ